MDYSFRRAAVYGVLLAGLAFSFAAFAGEPKQAEPKKQVEPKKVEVKVEVKAGAGQAPVPIRIAPGGVMRIQVGGGVVIQSVDDQPTEAKEAPKPKPRPVVPADPPLPPDRLAALVHQLGDESYDRRVEAARLLAGQQLHARQALLAGLGDGDLEIRRACRRLLAKVLEADFQRRLEALLADDSGTGKHDIPCWPRWREIYGGEKESRQLFVEMQRAEPALLEAAAQPDEVACQSFGLRWQQVFQAMYNPEVQGRRAPTFPTLAALIFVAVDTPVRFPAELSLQHTWGNVFYQSQFNRALNEGPYKPLARKLLVRWVLQRNGPNQNMQKLQLAVQHQIKEALGPALEMLKEPKDQNNNPHQTASAIEVVARLGGKPYAAALVPFLKDDRECLRQVVTINGKQESKTVEIRDVALAWLVELTGQDHAQYELAEIKPWFEQIRRYPQNGFNFYQMGFKDDSKREAVQKKLEEWLKGNPLPTLAGKPAGDGLPPPVAKEVVWQPGEKPAAASEVPGVAGAEMADRAQVKRLYEAQRLIEQRSYAPAVGLLGEILAAEDDFFFRPNRGAPLYRRLKPAAEAILAQLPAEALAEYDAQFGAAARAKLDAAVAAGKTEALAEVVQDYYYTQAGAEAAWLLGTHYRVAGRPLRAAFYLQRLAADGDRGGRFQPALTLELAACYLQSYRPELAQEALVRWRQTAGSKKIVIGGREHPLFDADDRALPWLEAIVGPRPPAVLDWAMFGGNPARNVVAGDAEPLLKPQYTVDGRPEAELRESIDAARKQIGEARKPAVPSLFPLVVGQTIVARTATEVRAIDLSTGNVRWRAALEDPLQSYLASIDGERNKQSEDIVQRGLGRRLWEDIAFGSMSSDGRNVYGLEGMPFHLGADSQAVLVLPNGRRQLDPGFLKNYNLLTAYDLASGKILWEAGGPPGNADNPLAGAFFVGPPLPLDGQLYIVADMPNPASKEIQTRLFALNPADGHVAYQWMLTAREDQPAMPGFNPGVVTRLNSRRGVAAPAYSDGVLVCGTSDNRFVGVDLTTRLVLWCYEGPQENVNPMALALRQARQVQQEERPDRWLDPGMVIADGRVLLTPRDSDQLVCLRLADGQLEWTAPRRDGLYVGGVRGDRAVVVGRQRLWTIGMNDGKFVWEDDALLPPAAVPSGRGFLGRNHYYLPLSTAEIATVDLANGRIVARSRSVDGAVPGNLVNHRGVLLSQSVEGLSRFDDLAGRDRQLAAALTQTPDDPALLAQRGEVLLYQGRQLEAVELLRRSLAKAPGERTRQLLAEALIEGLRLDFAKFQPLVTELDPLLGDPALRGRFLLELAQGRRRAGHAAQAFDAYMKWIDLGLDAGQMDQVDTARRVRIDRRIQAGLYEIWQGTRPEDRAALDRAIAGRLRPDRLPQFLDFFAFHPTADSVRMQLAQRARENRRAIEADLYLARVLENGDPTPRGAALAEQAALLKAAGRFDEAAALYKELAGPLADVPCVDGKTGRQLLAALGPDDPVRRAMTPPDLWPGEPTIEIERRDQNRTRSVNPRFMVWTPGCPRTFAVHFNSEGQTLGELDGQGRPRWKMPLQDAKIHPNFLGYVQQSAEGRVVGHLLVAMLGNRVAAIDTLEGKVLWSADSPTTKPDQPGVVQNARRRFQMQRMVRPLASPFPSPLVATAEYTAFEQDRRLLVVDTMTGRPLWSYDDLPPDADLFGDHAGIYLAPSEGGEAVVLSPLDGRELGRRVVPALSKRLALFGRRILTWDAGANGAELTLLDPWDAKIVWRKVFQRNAQVWLHNDEIGVLEPKGQFHLLAADGTETLLAQTDPLEWCDGIVFRRRGDRVVLLTNSRRPEPNPFGDFVPMGNVSVSGWAYGFDASGKRLWTVDLPPQAFYIQQPAEAPVLVFFRRTMKAVQLPNGGITHEPPQSNLLCLDVRSGKILQKDTSPGQDDQYEQTLDPAAGRIEVHSYTRSLILKYPAVAGNRNAK